MQQIEIKKHSLTQLQSGEWKITFTLLPDDMPDELVKARMGHRLYMWLIDADDYDNQNPTVKESLTVENHTDFHTPDTPEFTQVQTEGDKLRVRAVMLGKDKLFQEYTRRTCYDFEDLVETEEEFTSRHLKLYCNIKSRSELATNINAQQKFKELLAKFDSWKMEQTYKDNLERV